MTESAAWTEPDHDELRRILRETRTVAVVGASANPTRPSYGVWEYLRDASHYELYLVNPTVGEIAGHKVYPTLADLPVKPDMVDVFRRSSELPGVLKEAVDVGAKTLWLQQGLWDEQVAADGTAAGLQVVMDRCLKVDYARLL
ncbi:MULTISPECIES: CoA-binding protein [Mycobacteriaceae]|uniref:CoA-binding protein n=1 Tax=Mycobacteriaceae TaxID=1762 RepID=UPI0007FBF902|nr:MULTISPECIES: CoA-binding protein [Mycobacteriaceae]MCK0177140.1 CoA-binding protein [Mycolicibacterium sp. F2034L]OBB57391.1 CoA-binding protein [Mycobacterium sp. 852013-51886_SCH5428379]